MNRKERRRLEKAARQTGDTESARPPTGGGRVSSGATATSGAPRGGAGADIPAILRRAFAFHTAGRTRQALGLYRRILAAQPNHAEALNHAGIAAFQLGDTADAVELLRAASRLPGNAEAHNNLGTVLQASDDLDGAVASYRRALEIDSGNAEAHKNLGIALHKSGDPDAAAAACRRALAIDPGFAGAHNALGVALEAADDLDGAVAAYRRAVEIEPGFVGAHCNLGSVLKAAGEFDAAGAAYRRAIEVKPDLAEAYQHLAGLKTFTAPDGDTAAMEGLLSRPSITDGQAMLLGFALGKAYDDMGEYDRAFGHVEKGNRLKRASLRYDAADDEELAERIAALFTGEFLHRHGGPGAPPGQPIFIVGMPRSGTTLVEHILASHSRVYGGGELADLRRLAGGLNKLSPTGREFPDGVADLGPKDLHRLGRTYWEAVRRRAPEAPHVTDKAPGNFRYLGLIHLMLPRARIIHCVRNPVDTCLSCYKLLFVSGQNFSYDLVELGRYHRLYARLMDHWRAVMPGRILDVRYEDLVAGQEQETRRLLDFCGLPWEDACLSFHTTKRLVKTASATQVRRPIYKSAVGSWNRYARHLGPLVEALGPLAGDS